MHGGRWQIKKQAPEPPCALLLDPQGEDLQLAGSHTKAGALMGEELQLEGSHTRAGAPGGKGQQLAALVGVVHISFSYNWRQTT
jgi:hypothetical protein